MSIGNLKDSGNQGNNFPWQWKVLKGLQGIYDEVKKPLTCAEDSITICPPPGGLPVVIDCDDRISLCVDGDIVNAANALPVTLIDPIPLEVDINQADDSILIYGFDGVANQPISTDSNGHLQVDVLTTPGTFAEDTAHVSGNTGAFVLGVRNDLNTVMTNADGDYSPIAVNDEGAVAIQDGGNSITVDATNLDIRDLVFATDKVDVSNSTVALDATTLTALENITVQNGAGASAVNIQDGNNSITVDSNAVVRTPTILRTSTNSSIAAGAYSVSFASVGTANATVGGQTLKPGETINFDAGAINNTLGAVAYDSSAVGAELLIITLT
jgi:hypothetical protein